ncbi:DUF1828 domain-containing protein [Streptococcus suis]|nr:DUF1828 domain-containing protein [Streptococcus suis]
MTTTAKTLKRAYFDWLLQEYTYTDIEKNVIEIGTPFLDNDFDYITMYAVISQTGQITLTDDGWTLNNLKSHGVTFDGRSKHKQKLLHEITASLGIEVSDDHELMIRTDLDKFPLAKQRLLQSIVQVNDLIVLQDNSVKSIFFEEVENFKWTKADFDALVVGETLSGVGGTNLDEIIAKFGEPQTSSESSSENYTTKYVDYNTMGGTEYKSVSLQFVQQEDGSWLLSYKHSSGIE